MDDVLARIKSIQENVTWLIMTTPSGGLRNLYTDINIHLMAIIYNLELAENYVQGQLTHQDGSED